MFEKIVPKLDHRKRYLQLALNSTLHEAKAIIEKIPVNERIILEAGTPLIKRYGITAIRKLREWYAVRIAGGSLSPLTAPHRSAAGLFGQGLFGVVSSIVQQINTSSPQNRKASMPPTTAPRWEPYIVADLKTMDRGATEVEMAAEAGASAAIAVGTAPTETLNAFIAACRQHNLDAMIDMMNVDYPLAVLGKLKLVPPIVLLHRGVDEERENREKMLPLHEIRRIKGRYDIMVSIAGGDSIREVQSSVFNDVDIVVVWKSVYHQTESTLELIEGFLRQIK